MSQRAVCTALDLIPVTGFSFAGTGTVTAGPNQLIILTGTGTPATAGPQTFTVTFGTSSCTFTVDCLPALSNDYFPRTTNSNWSYEIDDDPLDSLYGQQLPEQSVQ